MISNKQYIYKRARNYSRSSLSILFLFLISFSLNCVWADSGNSIPTYFDTVEKIFVGYCQRPAGPGGLLYWAGRLNASSGNLTDIIEAFANSAESQALYGTINSSNISSVVTSVFQALFNRPPLQAGLDYYVNGFNSGQFTAATIMLNILDGAQSQDLQSVNNKVTAANLFTRIIDPDLDGKGFQYYYSGSADARQARDFLSTVTSDPATIPTEEEIKALLVPAISYTYTILLPEGWISAEATDINNNGEVVGYGVDASGHPRGFIYSNGMYTTLAEEGWYATIATGINDNDQVVGYSTDYFGDYCRGFLYSNGAYTTLCPEGWYISYAIAINNSGQVVGNGGDTGWQWNAVRGFLYSNGTYTALLPEGWSVSGATGINNNGQVVGTGPDPDASPPGDSRGFLYSNGTYTILPLPEGWEADPTGINDNGEVVGNADDPLGPGERQVFLYSNGTYTTLLPAGWAQAYAEGINNNGEVVGFGYVTSGGGNTQGFLYSNGRYTILLPDGWLWSRATGINDSGQVVGYGEDASGQLRGFLGQVPASQIDILTDEASFNAAVNPNHVASFNIFPIGFYPSTALTLGEVIVELTNSGSSPIFGPPDLGFTTNFLSTGVQDGKNNVVITFPAGVGGAGMKIVSFHPVTVIVTDFNNNVLNTSFQSQNPGIEVSFLGFYSPVGIKTVRISSLYAPDYTPIVNIGDITYHN